MALHGFRVVCSYLLETRGSRAHREGAWFLAVSLLLKVSSGQVRLLGPRVHLLGLLEGRGQAPFTNTLSVPVPAITTLPAGMRASVHLMEPSVLGLLRWGLAGVRELNNSSHLVRCESVWKARLRWGLSHWRRRLLNADISLGQILSVGGLRSSRTVNTKNASLPVT